MAKVVSRVGGKSGRSFAAAMLCAAVALALVGMAVAHATASAADCQYGPGGAQYCGPQPTLTPTPVGNNYLDYLHLQVTIEGSSPVGAISFALFSPSDPTCANPVFTAVRQVNGNGVYDTFNGSGLNQANERGVWRWRVTYSGDPQNGSAELGCGSIEIDAQRSATNAQPWAGVVRGPGDDLAVEIALWTQQAHGGTLSATLYAPGDPGCSSSPVYTAVFDASGASEGQTIFIPGQTPAISEVGSRVATTEGTWHWVASYSGDSDNLPSFSECSFGEVFVGITPTGLSVGPIQNHEPVGTPLSAAAVVRGLGSSEPTGELTFELFGDETCSTLALFSSTVPVAGSGRYESSAWIADRAGRFYWKARYSGDSRNLPAVTVCDGSFPTSAIYANPTLANPSAPVEMPASQPLNLSVDLLGGYQPTGELTFRLYNSSDCSGPSQPKVVQIAGAGTYASGAFTALSPGAWTWNAEYAGDAANNWASIGCGAPITITPPLSLAPTLRGVPVPNVAHGGDTVYDRAQITGGQNLAGALTFKLFPNGTCEGSPVVTTTVRVRRNGWYRSASPGLKIPPRTATRTPKTWQWVVSYSGDANNAPVELGCGSQPITVVRR